MISGTKQQGPGKRIGKDLPPITDGTRTARAARPAQPMSKVAHDALAANAVFDHVRREQHAISKFRGALADHEILCQELLQVSKPAHLFQHAAAYSHRTAQ